MARSISSVYRRENFIALTVPKRAGKNGFRFSFARNFDASFTSLQVVPNYGFKSASIPDGTIDFASSYKDQVVFVFRPSDYTASIPTMIDGVPLYFRVEARNLDGSFDSPEAMHLILPNEIRPSAPFILRGQVPNAAGLSSSLEIQLPARCQDWQIKVDGGSNLEVAFDSGGPEYVVLPETTTGQSFEQIITSANQIFLRGAGGASNISAIFTLANNPVT